MSPLVAQEPAMKAVGMTQFGGPEVLNLVDLPEPQVGQGQVRIAGSRRRGEPDRHLAA